jgi:hypothetical protein
MEEGERKGVALVGMGLGRSHYGVMQNISSQLVMCMFFLRYLRDLLCGAGGSGVAGMRQR